MNCTVCSANKIGPETEPFGGFLCSNNHLQCYECTDKGMALLCKCGASTKFVKMKFGSAKSPRPPFTAFSRQMSDEIETKSRLSNEHLSMNSSAESINQIAQQMHDAEAQNLGPEENPTSFIGCLDDHNIRKCLNTEQDFGPTMPSSCGREEIKCLSAKVLEDFDSQNLGFKNQVVNNYLKACSSASFHPSGMEPTKQKLELEIKPISISTESDPSLTSTCLRPSENSIVGKLNPQDYCVMQAADVTPDHQFVNLVSDKSKNVPIIDVCMQKIFEALKEDIRVNGLAEQSYLTRMPMPFIGKEQEEKWTVRTDSSTEDKNSDLMAQLSNTYRAHYNLPLPYEPAELLRAKEPPSPQFKRVPCSNAMAQELLLRQTDLSNAKTVPANLLHIPRSPILCPESTCQRMIFVSDFNKHLVVDHSHLPMERITPFQCKNFFLDARLFKNGESKCHLLYLLCDKIIGLGSTEYKDLLPVLVMTSCISAHEICDLGSQASSALDYFLIWVTGIAPEELPISVSLTVWSRAATAPSCHIVYSGQIYSIRNSQCASDVWQSGRTLLLSSQQIAALTSNGTEMLNFQLSVH